MSWVVIGMVATAIVLAVVVAVAQRPTRLPEEPPDTAPRPVRSSAQAPLLDPARAASGWIRVPTEDPHALRRDIEAFTELEVSAVPMRAVVEVRRVDGALEARFDPGVPVHTFVNLVARLEGARGFARIRGLGYTLSAPPHVDRRVVGSTEAGHAVEIAESNAWVTWSGATAPSPLPQPASGEPVARFEIVCDGSEFGEGRGYDAAPELGWTPPASAAAAPEAAPRLDPARAAVGTIRVPMTDPDLLRARIEEHCELYEAEEPVRLEIEVRQTDDGLEARFVPAIPVYDFVNLISWLEGARGHARIRGLAYTLAAPVRADEPVVVGATETGQAVEVHLPDAAATWLGTTTPAVQPELARGEPVARFEVRCDGAAFGEGEGFDDPPGRAGPPPVAASKMLAELLVDADQRIENGDPWGELVVRQAEHIQVLEPHLEEPGRFGDCLEQLHRWVRRGYREEPEAIAANWADLLQHECGLAPEVGQGSLLPFVGTALGHLRAVEQRWTEPTMNDRVTQAFRQLRGDGVLALENCGFSTSDGWVELVQNRHLVPGAVGGAFFHEQDVDHGVEGHGLWIAFGPLEEVDDPAAVSIAVAKQVAAALRANDVPVDWDGDPDNKLRIPPFPWRRRLGDVL